MSEEPQKHVFVSYVRENQSLVDRLCADLEKSGVHVWLDRKDIRPGARWKDAIREAIRKGDFFIACFSNEYASKTKSYMNEELTLAIEELRQFGAGREWFIPVLLTECDVPDRSIGAGETLLDINWVNLYEDWNAGILKILSVIKPIPTDIQSLINLLHSENKDLCQQAAQALGRIGPAASLAVPALVETLKDWDRKLRQSAAEALGNIGPEAKAAVPGLLKSFDYEFDYVVLSAMEALGKIGPAANPAVPALVKALNRGTKVFRKTAANVLGCIGPEAKSAVPALIKALEDEHIDIQQTAATAIGKMGPEGKDAVPALIEMLNNKMQEVLWEVLQALENIGLEAKAAVPALIEMLKDRNIQISSKAAYVLQEINSPEAQKALKGYVFRYEVSDKSTRITFKP